MGDSRPVPDIMTAMRLIGHGGFDELVYRQDMPAPKPAAGEVRIEVAACGVDNTDIRAHPALSCRRFDFRTIGLNGVRQ